MTDPIDLSDEFIRLSALESSLVGVRLEALEATLAAIGYVVGDVDREVCSCPEPVEGP